MIALIGGLGSIGKRYQAILKYLEAPYRILDIGTKHEDLDGCSKAIICSPTNAHIDYCHVCHLKGIQFLCEKPLSKNKNEIQELMDGGAHGFVVNNYAFLSTHWEVRRPSHLLYNFFNTGRDGLVWDVCQLVMLAHKLQCPLEIRTDSFEWTVEWGDLRVEYRDIEMSYLQMIRSFIEGDTRFLWNLHDALKMTELCELIEKELKETGGHYDGFFWNPGQNWIQAISEKSPREDRAERTYSMVV